MFVNKHDVEQKFFLRSRRFYSYLSIIVVTLNAMLRMAMPHLGLPEDHVVEHWMSLVEAVGVSYFSGAGVVSAAAFWLSSKMRPDVKAGVGSPAKLTIVPFKKRRPGRK